MVSLAVASYITDGWRLKTPTFKDESHELLLSVLPSQDEGLRSPQTTIALPGRRPRGSTDDY